MKSKFLLLLLSVFGSIQAAQERMSFTGTYVLGRVEDLPARVLDYPVMALPLIPIEYPTEMRSTGMIDHVCATLWVEADGHVSRAIVGSGSDTRLREPTQKAIAGWRFSRPMKEGRPVAALLQIRITFADAKMQQIIVEEPNKASQPTSLTRRG